VINVNRRNVTPENFNGFLSAISLVNFPREFSWNFFGVPRPTMSEARSKALLMKIRAMRH
jgi:hypothetical protein